MSSLGMPVSYQQHVYNELRESARDYFDGEWHGLPVNVRIAPLIVGSSGVGKTYLARRLAAELCLPLFQDSVSDWILLGCSNKGAPPTLPRLYRFLERHERGIIFLDEIEKLGSEVGASDWRRFLQLEFFGILDRKISAGVMEDDEWPKFKLTPEQLGERFKKDFFILGAGAWQNLWARTGPPIGFNEGCGRSSQPNHEQLSQTLRLEILNRFGGQVLLLPPLSVADYRHVFLEIAERIPAKLRSALEHPKDEELLQAFESQKGFRFFEEVLALAVRKLRLTNPPHKPGVLLLDRHSPDKVESA